MHVAYVEYRKQMFKFHELSFCKVFILVFFFRYCFAFINDNLTRFCPACLVWWRTSNLPRPTVGTDQTCVRGREAVATVRPDRKLGIRAECEAQCDGHNVLWNGSQGQIAHGGCLGIGFWGSAPLLRLSILKLYLQAKEKGFNATESGFETLGVSYPKTLLQRYSSCYMGVPDHVA